MKRIKTILMMIVILTITASSAFSQEAFSPRFTIKTNPLAALGGPFWVAIIPVTGEYKVLFEAKTLPKQSVTVGASYIGPSLLLNLDELSADGEDISGINTAGFKVQLMYKFFISRNTEAPEGFYVGPHGSYASASITSKDVLEDKIGMTKMNVNAVIGYQMITDGGFTLDFYTGFGFKDMKWSFEGDSGEVFELDVNDKASPSVAFGLNFGYAF